MIDFGEYRAMSTYYTLRHHSSWDRDALRHLRLERSCDGDVWTVIHEHNNDATFEVRGELATWRLRFNQHFSNFCVFQYDKNSNGHYYLALPGLEIYGAIMCKHKGFVCDQWPKDKSLHLQADLNANTVTNVDSDNTCQSVRVTQPFNFQLGAKQEFTILIEKVTETTKQQNQKNYAVILLVLVNAMMLVNQRKMIVNIVIKQVMQ